jgi:hypothetical protein
MNLNFKTLLIIKSERQNVIYLQSSGDVSTEHCKNKQKLKNIPKGGKKLWKCEKILTTYDPLAICHGNREGNEKFSLVHSTPSG